MAGPKQTSLHFDVSPHALVAGYKQPTPDQRLAATRPSGRVQLVSNSAQHTRSDLPSQYAGDLPPDSTFPAPLALPGDELSWEPKYPPQSLRSWIQDKHRNVVSDERRAIYVVPPPDAMEIVRWVKGWAVPDIQAKRDLQPPDLDDVVAYLQAFYHDMPVTVLQQPTLRFCKFEETGRPMKRRKGAKRLHPDQIGLDTGTGAYRIRARKRDVYSQLNLNDLLDAAMWILPDDAYALLMIVNQDLYEDDEDDFCCGRAYGGSRVAVVSTARYNPLLDDLHEVDREYAWPASHRTEYVESCCSDVKVKKSKSKKPKSKQRKPDDTRNRSGSVLAQDSAMAAALAAHQAVKLPAGDDEKSDHYLRTLWLSRVCKTASHELGHCFCMDHCVYYACVMQGTAGLSEDARQPPYLCPVDTAKLLKATGADEGDWLEAMLAFCERYNGDRLFAAFAAWLRARLLGTRAELTDEAHQNRERSRAHIHGILYSSRDPWKS